MELSQVLQALRNADAAGDVEGARRLAEIARRLSSAQAEAPAAKRESTFGSELVRGGKQVLSSGQTALESITRSPEEAALRGIQRGEQIAEEAGEGVSWERVKRTYDEEGLLGAAGRVVTDLPKALASQGANLAGIAGSAKAGALTGAKVAGPKGAIAGGVLGAGAYLIPQFFGSNVERQASEDIEQGRPVDIETGKALLAATGQAGVEAAGTAFILGGRVVKSLLGVSPAKAAASETAKAKLIKLAQETIKGGVVRGSAVEMPVEIAQQVIERAQAGMDVLSDDAIAEYGDAAYQAALVGGPVKGISTAVSRSGAKRELEAMDQQEQAKAAAEAAQLAQVEEQKQAAFKQSPEYALDVEQRFNAFNEQVKALRAQTQQKIPAEDLAGKQAQKEAGQQLSELIKENRPLITEYNAIKGTLPAIKEQQRVAGLSPMDYALEQTPEVPATAKPKGRGLESADAELGFVSPTNPVEQYASERVRLAQEQQLDPDANIYAEYLLQDPQMAANWLASETAIPGLSAKEQRDVRKSVQDILALQEKQRRDAERAQQKAQSQANVAALQEQDALLRAQKPAPEPKADLFAQQQEDLAQQREQAQQDYQENLDFATPMLERATQQPAPAVPIPDTVPAIGPEATQTVERVESLIKASQNEGVYSTDTATRDAARQQKNAASAQLAQIAREGDPYAKELVRVRNEQSGALMDLQDTLEDLRRGAFFGGSEVETASSFRSALDREVADARSRYIKALLEEAAINRRARNEPPLTTAEATKAAMDARQLLDELIDRGQAKKDNQGLVQERRAEPGYEAYQAQRRLEKAENRVLNTQRELESRADEAGTRNDIERVQLEKLLARRMLELEKAKKAFAEMPKRMLPGYFSWRRGDPRELAERPFGNFRAAVATQLDGLEQIRQGLNQPLARQPGPEGLRGQYAETEARRVAEARGETATTLGGELRRRTEYVRDKMSRMKGMRPQASGVLNRAADLMDTGKATRDLLDAVEPVIDTINNGQMPFARDLRAIDDAIKATAPTAREQQEAGQRQLFDEIGDRKQRSDETGYVKKTPAEFENSPPMRKARSAVQQARKAEEAFRQFLKNTTKLREQQRRQDAADRVAKVENLQSAVATQQKRLQDAQQLAETEAREALQVANKAAAAPQLLAAQNALREAQQALTRQEQRQGLFTAEELAQLPDVEKQMQKQLADQKTAVAEAQQALDTLLSEVLANVDAAQLQEATANDTVLTFERDILAKLQQTLEELSAKQTAPSEERVRAAKTAADQRAAVAVAEKRARDAKDAAAKQRAALQDRMAKGFDLPKFTAEDLGAKQAIRAQLGAIETQLSLQDEGVQRAQERLEKVKAQPVDKNQKRRVRDAEKAVALAEDAAGARKEQLEELARGLRARLGAHDYMTAEQRAAEKLAKAQSQQRQISTESMKELEEARRRTQRATGPVTRGDSGEPKQMRTGSAESRAGENATKPANVGLTESRKPVVGAKTLTTEEMSEANRLAEELRNKTPAQKRKEAEAARKEAAELAKEQAKWAQDDSDLDTYASEIRDGTVYETRPETDLNDATVEAVKDGRIVEVLERLQSEASTPFNRALAKRLVPLLLKTKLRVQDGVKDKDGNFVEGMFYPDTNTVVVDRASLTEETLLHELTHAATLEALGADPKTLTTEQQQARAELESLFNDIQGEGAFKKEFAGKNIKEFVAELMANKQVRDKLDQRNFLQRIYDAILRMLGVPPPAQTRSERAVENAYKLFMPSRVTKAPAVASVLRGVFPGSAPKFAANVPQAVRAMATPSASSQTAGQKVSAFGLGFRTLALDRWAPMEYLIKRGLAKGQITETQAQQSRIHMRLHEDSNRFTATSLMNGVVQLQEENGKKFYGGAPSEANMRNVVAALRDAGIGDTTATLNTWQTWMQIQRAERLGIGLSAMNIKNPPSAADVQALKSFVNSDQKTKDAFDKARELYKQYNKDLMRSMSEAGTLPKDIAKQLGDADYIPYYRLDGTNVVMDGIASRPITIGSLLDQPSLKELVGDSRQMMPVLDSIVQNTSMITRMNLRNLQARDTSFLLQQMGLGKVIEGEGPANVIRFKRDGKNFWLKMDPEAFPEGVSPELVLSGMQGIKTAVPTLVKWMGIPTRLLRSAITRMPMYVARQLIRDPLFAWITTGANFTPVVSSIKELTKIRRGLSPTEEALQRSGAISSSVQTGDYQDTARMIRDISAGTKNWNSLMMGIDNFAMQADASTRAVLYDTYRKEGMDHVDAMLGAAESMNFSRRGTSASLYNLSTMIPFFNAQLQGIDAMYRAVKGDTIYEKRMDVRAKLIKRGLLMAGMTAAYAAAMQDDEAYKNATPQERAMNWFVYLPGVDDPIRVPIPFEPGLMFKAVPEVIFNTMLGDTTAKEAARAIGSQLWMSTPLQLPTAINPIVELATNYSFFTDRQIESSRDLTVDKEERSRPGTTELAKTLGNSVVSPVQIEHLVRGYTGSAGILLMSMFNYPLRSMSEADMPEKPEKTLSETPLFGPAFQPTTGRGAIDAAYEDAKRYQRASQTFNKMIEEGRGADARAYAERFSREIALASTGGAFTQQMGVFAEIRRSIMAAPPEVMSAQEKKDRLQQIKTYEALYAQQFRKIGQGAE